MDVLLDTHIALWALSNSHNLSTHARELIQDPKNRLFISDVSAWEIAMKHLAHPDKMPLSATHFVETCNKAGYETLHLTLEAIFAYEALDTSDAIGRHKDPFDRMLISQAKAASMLLLTHDRALLLYGEPLVACV